MKETLKDYRVLWTLILCLTGLLGIGAWLGWEESKQAKQLARERAEMQYQAMEYRQLNDTLKRYVDHLLPILDKGQPLIEAGRPGRRFGRAEESGSPSMALKNQVFQQLKDSSRSEIPLYRTSEGFRLVIHAGVLFNLRETALTESGQSTLKPLAPVLNRAADHFVILVQGHSDPGEVGANLTLRVHWDLSYQRAAAVAEYLVTQLHTPASSVAIEACGSNFPSFSTGAAIPVLNRRVEIWLLPKG